MQLQRESSSPKLIPTLSNIIFSPYIAFRVRIAKFELTEVITVLKNSAQIIALILGPVLLSVLAVVSLPLLLAPKLSSWLGIAAILAQSILFALPIWLLRKKLIPASISLWVHSLPISSRTHIGADAVVAGVVLKPIAIACILSAAFWFYQWPTWLRLTWPSGLAAIFASLLSAWGLSVVILLLRRRSIIASTGWTKRAENSSTVRHAISRYTFKRPCLQSISLWIRLYWLPYWRQGNMFGMRLMTMLLSAILSAIFWTSSISFLSMPRPALGFITSVLLTLVTYKGSAMAHKQTHLLQSVWMGWPIDARRIEYVAKIFPLLPPLIVLLAFASTAFGTDNHVSGKMAAFYTGLGCCTCIAIICSARLSARSQMAVIFLSTLLLTAIGGELWI